MTTEKTAAGALPAWVAGVLACPVCKGEALAPDLEVACPRCPGRAWRCATCGSHFPDAGGPSPLLVPFTCSESPSPTLAAWQRSQRQFLGWQSTYQVATAAADLRTAEEVHARFQLSGRVLDIGGSAGMARRFLAPGQEYLSVDPDLTWRDRLAVFSQVYPEVVEPFPQLLALAEHLPLRTAQFDSILMRAVIDHCYDAHLALAEAHRILRPGGGIVVGLSLGGVQDKLRSLITTQGPAGALAQLGRRGFNYLRRGVAGYGTGHAFHIHRDDVPALLREHGFDVTSEVRSTVNPRVFFYVARRPA